MRNRKISVGGLYGIQNSKFDFFTGDSDKLKDQLMAITIGNQLGRSPFFVKIAMGIIRYNHDSLENYSLNNDFYGSGHLLVFIGKGKAKGNNRITAEISYNTVGSLGFGVGILL